MDLENIKKQAEEGLEAVKDKAEDLKDKAEDAVEAAKDKAEDVVSDIKDKLGKGPLASNKSEGRSNHRVCPRVLDIV